MKTIIEDFGAKKKRGEKITMLTCYDFPTAILEDQAGIDVLLVGDSVGTNVLGYSDIRDVTMNDMLHHVGAVARGAHRAFVLADMPFGSCNTAEQAIENARGMIRAGADAVKIEGESESAELIAAVVQAGIPVCAHIGYTPQSRGPKAVVQGKDPKRAASLLVSGKDLERAGAFMVVLELLPEELAREITSILHIPTIGIGAGRYCDGQVQVINDILGLSLRIYRHSKAFCQGQELFSSAMKTYAHDVISGQFPQENNAVSMTAELVSEALEISMQPDSARSSHGQSEESR